VNTKKEEAEERKKERDEKRKSIEEKEAKAKENLLAALAFELKRNTL
jgi:hypothetical protein